MDLFDLRVRVSEIFLINLRSVREDVRQLLSACRSRSIDLELQVKGSPVSPILLGFRPINSTNLIRLNYLI